MKTLLFSCQILLLTLTSYTVSSQPILTLPEPDSFYTVTIHVVSNAATAPIPVNGAIVSTSRHGEVATDEAGTAAPIEVKAGDTISVSAEGYSKKSIVFSPVIVDYSGSEQTGIESRHLSITIVLAY
ncbi:hypothetical protein [Chitinophaga sp. Cy-1792]|uniref:hypothetical protein n=1 Tax=Chitinophaga sp. Cy-1792 TaxID=2608339 RepID=UPI00141E19C8|nr:hypothetical protein [Chitinophaga sp. Cy-1792]NIG56617.1 hypothetical protein [Chitinophaga sp. Cy-1792]